MRSREAREPRRPERASIFTRFSLVPVRVHFGGPRVPVELKHARRGKSLLRCQRPSEGLLLSQKSRRDGMADARPKASDPSLCGLSAILQAAKPRIVRILEWVS